MKYHDERFCFCINVDWLNGSFFKDSVFLSSLLSVLFFFFFKQNISMLPVGFIAIILIGFKIEDQVDMPRFM